MKRVEIHWVDIIHESGWRTLDELEAFDQAKSKTVVQIAYLYEEDEDQVILLDSYFEDKSLYGTVHIIPKGCIKEIKEI
jgi:hypothetical protein